VKQLYYGKEYFLSILNDLADAKIDNDNSKKGINNYIQKSIGCLRYKRGFTVKCCGKDQSEDSQS